MEHGRTTALVVCNDDAHAFLLESILKGEADDVVHVDSANAAVRHLLDGLAPELVLVDVALDNAFEGDSTAVAELLRVVAPDAVVLEVGERLEHSGEQLARRLRGNSVEAREWAELRA